MRILHLADVHLDTSFSGRSARIRARLRQATRDAFRNAVELALDREVHAVLVAGDLFDSARLSFETERFLVAELARLTDAGVPVIYATGNHDPGSVRATRREIPWPPGVTVLGDGEPRRIPVRDRGGEVVGWVTGAGHASANETRDLAARFPTPRGPLPEAALLHTQVVGSRDAEAHDPYAPSALDTLTGAGYDYWALGHVHVRQTLADLPGVHYPGNIQGRTPRETGAKGALLVELTRGFAPQVEFHALAPVRWEALEVRDPVEANSLDGLLRLVNDRWADQRRADPDPEAEWMVRVHLTGSTPLWRELEDDDDRAHLARELEALMGALEVRLEATAVHAPVSVEDHLAREDVLGVALRLVDRVRSGEISLPGLDDELATGARGDDGEPALSDLLQGAEAELVSRLLRGEA
ncbi:MAG TPA: DNA repair exonuclease [Longimicrobiales bacterium]|nr:DNA repair exonuclease [Longimicrobiales bacterium]